jgi:YHS domain-containing protein
MRALFIGLLLLTACAKVDHHEGHMGSAGADPKAVPTAPVAFEAAPALGTKAFCPVSKESFTVNAKTTSATYKGKTYVFCCPECKPEFEANPEKFAATAQVTAQKN